MVSLIYGTKDPKFDSFKGSHATGLGGGGFVLVRSANGSFESVDFRETAPAAAFENMYNNNVKASLIGGLAR